MSKRIYRQVESGTPVAGCVTVRIAAGPDGRPTAGMWWTSQTGLGSAAFDDVGTALEAAEAHRVRHDLEEVLVTLDGVRWHAEWGELLRADVAREPMGDIRRAGLSDEEYSELAEGIESQRDA
ncbi:MAG: hypothetical protein ACOH2N_16965 [Devosia sp.]